MALSNYSHCEGCGKDVGRGVNFCDPCFDAYKKKRAAEEEAERCRQLPEEIVPAGDIQTTLNRTYEVTPGRDGLVPRQRTKSN